MDISTISTVSEDEGTFVHFKDVAGEPLYDGLLPAEGEADTRTPVGAWVAGTYSKRHRTAKRKFKEKGWKAARRGEDLLDIDRLEAADLEIEAACIIRWTFTAGGEPFPITADNWGALVKKQPQWQDQLTAAMTDHARFFKPS